MNKFDDILSLKNLRKGLKSIRAILTYKAILFCPDHITDKETAISVIKELIEHISKRDTIYNAIFSSKVIKFPDNSKFRYG